MNNGYGTEVKGIPLKPQMFSELSPQLLKLLHNCEDHFHFYSLSAMHIEVCFDFSNIKVARGTGYQTCP